MFDVKGDRAQWRVIYDRLSDMKVGEVIKYDEIVGLLPEAAEGSWRGAFNRAVKEMEAAMSRSFDNVRGVGYRMVAANEHERLARRHHKRAKRQLVRSVSKAHSADRSQLTRDERARLDALELNLAQQVELTKRLTARIQRETQERKSEVAAVSDKVDRLAALMERHGITADA